MGDWPLVAINDLVEDIIDRRGVTPIKLGSNFTAAGHRVISAKLVKGGAIDLAADEPRYVDEQTYARWMRSQLRADDVILTSEAPLGEVAYLGSDVDWVLGQRLFALRSDKRRLHGRFLYYALQTDPSRSDLHSRATGTTAQGVRQTELRRVRIPLPPLTEQRRITGILGALDDKIELNRRRAEALTSCAAEVYRQVAGMASRDGAIGEIAEVIDCLHSKKPERRNSGRPLLQLYNIRDDGLLDMADAYLIDESDYALWTSRVEAAPGDCVITNVGRVGAVAQVPDGVRAALGRNMTAVRCRAEFSYPTFLLQALLSDDMRDEITLKTDTGTILDALNVRNIPRLRLPLPGGPDLIRFEETVRPLRARMEQALAESRALAAIRETLLPHLLSGQLETHA